MKSVPVSVTLVPPLTVPFAGEIDVRDGTAAFAGMAVKSLIPMSCEMKAAFFSKVHSISDSKLPRAITLPKSHSVESLDARIFLGRLLKKADYLKISKSISAEINGVKGGGGVKNLGKNSPKSKPI